MGISKLSELVLALDNFRLCFWCYFSVVSLTFLFAYAILDFLVLRGLDLPRRRLQPEGDFREDKERVRGI